MKSSLEQKIASLPSSPGVYLFKNHKSEVIYVGKAKRLKLRVRSYFQKKSDLKGKAAVMVGQIKDLEVIITDTEAEALILENTLIKEHYPRYNILYRDDKTYPYICVTNEERPRIFPTRTIKRDGSRYYGPYDHVLKMRVMLETIRKAFRLCTCACSSRMVDQSKGLPKWRKCFENYFDGCSEEIQIEEYQNRVLQVVQLLNGKTDNLIRELKQEMETLSEALRFEEASEIRDGIYALQKYSTKMKIITADGLDRDVFALEADHEENIACGVLLKIREGKLIGKYHRYLRNIEGVSISNLLQSFAEDYYTGGLATGIPDEVYLSHYFEDDEPLFEYLWQEKGRKVPLQVPQKGVKSQLANMAASNARLLLKEWILEKMKADKGRVPHSIEALQRDLALKRLPRRIECFDISNLQGTHIVASMVCFVDAKERKSEYKRYHIKSVKEQDDFASMREVIYRRYNRLKASGGQIPDLIVVDGGKGQLSSATNVLKSLELDQDIPVIGLAKRLEEVFIPGLADAVMIPKTSSSLKLLQRLRNEAHRFAITFHRDVRSKKAWKTELLEIPGIGPKKAIKLLQLFGSLEEILNQDKKKLTEAIGKTATDSMLGYFEGKEGDNREIPTKK